jgi:nicotinamidase-related amidase
MRSTGDAGLWVAKIRAIGSLRTGSSGVEIDPRLGRRKDEPVIVKKFASVFFGTGFVDQRLAAGVDTLSFLHNFLGITVKND